MTVFKEVYEVVGAEARRDARAFKAKQVGAISAQWRVAKSLGGVGFRPGNGGGIRTVFFPKANPLPTGWRRVNHDGERVEAAPSRNTISGRAAAKVLAGAPVRKEWREFADAFGWKGRMPMSSEGGRGVIYFASGVAVSFPKERFFLTFPRELKDGWKPPKGLKLVRESDMLRALEDHNAEAKRREKRKKEKAA